MSMSREKIFSCLQQAQNKNKSGASENIAVVSKQLSDHKRSVLPAYTESNLTRFITKLTKVEATVNCIKNTGELSSAVNEYLLENNINPTIVAAPSEKLQQINWQDEMSVEFRVAVDSDLTTLTYANAGVAETGSLVLFSGDASPTTLNFLPDNNICVIHQDKIFPYMEDIWDLLRKEKNGVPRTINFITGPSRTADVEQTIQLGAHGPRRLHVIIVENI